MHERGCALTLALMLLRHDIDLPCTLFDSINFEVLSLQLVATCISRSLTPPPLGNLATCLAMLSLQRLFAHVRTGGLGTSPPPALSLEQERSPTRQITILAEVKRQNNSATNKELPEPIPWITHVSCSTCTLRTDAVTMPIIPVTTCFPHLAPSSYVPSNSHPSAR